jgi:hypothetical protein
MAFDYATTLSRLRIFLMDSGSSVWADTDLQTAIRLGVGEVSLYNGAAVTLSGLDGAVTTTVATVLEAGLLVGAAGYAATARSVDRAEAYELGGESSVLLSWGVSRLEEWRAMLRAQYPDAIAATDLVAARELAADTRLAERELAADTRLASRELLTDTRASAESLAVDTRAAAREDAVKAAEAARVNPLRTTSNAAWGAWSDDFGEKGETALE